MITTIMVMISTTYILRVEFPSVDKIMSKMVGGLELWKNFLGLLSLVCLFLYTFYWAHDHNYHGDDKYNIYPAEVAARTFGVTAVAIMGLQLLPAAKSSPFLAVVGISWESAL